MLRRFRVPVLITYFSIAILLSLQLVQPASAQTDIVVSTTASTIADDGQCTLPEAARAARDNTASGATNGECIAGGATDTIDLTALSGVITIPEPLVFTDAVTVTGPGADVLTVQRGDDAPAFRIALVMNTDVTISDVTLRNGNDVSGAGVFVSGGSLILNNMTVSDGTATSAGGGLYNDGGLVQLTDVTLTNNTAASSGGGVFASNGTVQIVRSTVSDNMATSAGGGIYADTGNFTLTDSAVHGNTAGTAGGGVFSNALTLGQFSNVTLSGDSAGTFGGALHNESGTLSLNNATVSGDLSNASGAVTVSNSIFTEACTGILTSAGYNLFAVTDAGCVVTGDATGNITNVSPVLGVLTNNGGPTLTQSPLSGSPAIDAGSPTTCDFTDQRGIARPQGTACDIGAVEVEVAAAASVPFLTTSPANGEADVAVTRETIFRFRDPLRRGDVTGDTFTARFGQQVLNTRLHVSPDNRTVTLFYNPNLPSSARVNVTIDGDNLRNENGDLVDIDQDGEPGGTRTISFDTLTLTTLPNTEICGRVFASELGNNDVNVPLQNVRISVDGKADELFTTTDNNGNFCLNPAPAGRFFVHVDGQNVTNNVPEGGYYPSVGKAWESIPGETLNVGNIFLPLVPPNTLQEVSATETTEITVAPEVLEEFPELAGLMLMVPPDSLYNDDGSRGGRVGIAPVPSDRLPGPLPAGLNHALDITVQSLDGTNFDTPAPICFPNLPAQGESEPLPPGAQAALNSFNHDTGQWEIKGSMTVTPDGTLVCTDEGVGVEAPGWHWFQPPGG